MLRATPDAGGQCADDGALGNHAPPSIHRRSPRAPSRFPRVDDPSIPIAAALPRHNVASGQSGVSWQPVPSKHHELNGRESIQMGAPVRWMLVFMRAIYGHAEAVVAKAGSVESDAARDVVEDQIAVWDQQKRSATTQRHDSEALDLAFLMIADQSIECYSPSLPVKVAAPHCLSAAHS